MIDSPATVFLVDDDPSVLKGLERLLRAAGYRTESFPSAAAFLERWQQDPAHGCLLLDVAMPELDGLQLQKALELGAAAPPIVFLTGHGDIPMSVKAIKAGAVDFLTKPVRDENLLPAIEQALDRDRRQRAEREEREALAGRWTSLTPREREVLGLVARGLLNKQIAFELGASEKTIKIHRGRGMHKMRVASVADLVRLLQKLGRPPDRRSTPR
jgi:FixJ family two-component response regulator